jgi:hypothetical protein
VADARVALELGVEDARHELRGREPGHAMPLLLVIEPPLRHDLDRTGRDPV